ncbi:F-box/LRR-repeat protein 5 isoform X2 [Stigmatopora nigra]
MAPFPDEVDVFTGPHWRMKQLVDIYSEKLSETNFSNNSDFRSFLKSLLATFKEFKMHEQIENEYIIGLLEQRCRTVYNMHSDNKLSDMLLLLEKGLHNVKNEYEQLNYAQQLKEQLEAFTRDFLPHMKEEEEVFQPMLMQHFSYEELKDIKKQVMAQHRSRRPWDVLKGFGLWTRADQLQRAFKYADHQKSGHETEHAGRSWVHISQLPAEVLLRILRFLGPPDLCRCAQVCLSWSQLTKTGSLWRHLYPIRWARGDYYCAPPAERDQEPEDGWLKSREKEARAYRDWDEDADVDESDGVDDDHSRAVDTARREKRLLDGMAQNLLPAVGSAVKSLVLAYGSTVSSKMVRQMLSLCPNVTHLDLTQTDVGDLAFDSWSFVGACATLERLDLSGCEQVTDRALQRLSLGLGDPRRPRRRLPNGAHRNTPADIEDSAAEWARRLEARLLDVACRCRRANFRREDAFRAAAAGRWAERRRCGDGKAAGRRLAFLSLSGCFQITDAGLRALAEPGGLPVLEHLNLSGCLRVTEAGLGQLVSACPALNDEHFYYCDNIDGPKADTASGCQNLQCGFRACCRSGE